ncbi:MAG: glycosyl hydrolase 2 galactose-binding domain-containing protein, partial [Solirubrobacteraceae bacterium]
MLSCARRIAVEGHEVTPLDGLWQAVATDPGAVADAGALGPGLEWQEIEVPGNPRGAGDDRDWWFRRRFAAGPPVAGEEVVLELDGIATVAEVYVNGQKVLESDSMFAAHAVDVGALLTGDNELAICVRALDPLLAISRRPRARWRTRLVSSGGLRFFRTMLLGRAPGFAPGPPLVGPWRPVRLVRRHGVTLTGLTLRPRVEPGGAGVLVVEAEIRPLSGASVERVDAVLDGPNGTHRATLEPGAGGGLRGELMIDGVARWWPHTHGDPVLHAASLQLTLGGGRELAIDCGRVGFRDLRGGERLEEEGIQLGVNGV